MARLTDAQQRTVTELIKDVDAHMESGVLTLHDGDTRSAADAFHRAHYALTIVLGLLRQQ